MVDTERVVENQVLKEVDCFSRGYLIFCMWLWYKWLCFTGRECEVLSCMGMRVIGAELNASS